MTMLDRVLNLEAEIGLMRIESHAEQAQARLRSVALDAHGYRRWIAGLDFRTKAEAEMERLLAVAEEATGQIRTALAEIRQQRAARQQDEAA